MEPENEEPIAVLREGPEPPVKVYKGRRSRPFAPPPGGNGEQWWSSGNWQQVSIPASPHYCEYVNYSRRVESPLIL